MKVALELKDFAKYPFLKESQQFIREYADTIGEFIGTNPGKIALRRATDRVSDALGLNEEKNPGQVPTERFEVKLEVAGYALARVLVSCQVDRSVIDRLCRYEAARAFRYLLDEEEEKKEMVALSLGIHISGRSVPVVQYVEMVSGMREERWRLVNREVDSGRVQVNRDEMNESDQGAAAGHPCPAAPPEGAGPDMLNPPAISREDHHGVPGAPDRGYGRGRGGKFPPVHAGDPDRAHRGDEYHPLGKVRAHGVSPQHRHG